MKADRADDRRVPSAPLIPHAFATKPRHCKRAAAWQNAAAAAIEEQCERDVLPPPKKRARGGSAPTATIRLSHLPPEVLGQIFSHLGVRSLGRVAQVCRTWCAVVREEELWKSICERMGLLDPAKLAPAARMLKRGKSLRDKVLACPPGSKRLVKLQQKATVAYQRYYKRYRDRVCVHCASTNGRCIAYQLYDWMPICRSCRMLEPFAYISYTNACRFFKFGRVAVERPGENIPFATRWGTIYRFRDIVRLFELAVGPDVAAKNAKAARAALRIREVKVMELKDV